MKQEEYLSELFPTFDLWAYLHSPYVSFEEGGMQEHNRKK